MSMQSIWNEVSFVVGDAQRVEQMANLALFPPFAPVCVDFLDALSRRLLAAPGVRDFPDVLTFAFWCRKSSILGQKRSETAELRLGKGLVFHIAPSNVDVLFAYSLVAGLLAGNANLVRLSSRNQQLPDSAKLICKALNALLNEDFQDLRPYVACLRYGHAELVTAHLSALCDVRLIWGGDETIKNVRKSPLGPRATEITFANRFSLCAMSSEAWLAARDKAALARRFYTDTYLNDQNACTAPQLVFWLGEDKGRITAARESFWRHVEGLVRRDYPVGGAQSVAKLEMFCLLAASHPELRLRMNDTRLARLDCPELFPELMDYKAGGGFFFEGQGASLASLLPLLSGACQTIVTYGIEPELWASFLKTARCKGVDRVVELGRSMDFSLVWDGCDLISALSSVKQLFSGPRLKMSAFEGSELIK